MMGTEFSNASLEVHQPAVLEGEDRYLLKWSVEEAGRAFVDAGLITWAELDRTLAEMQEAIENPGVIVLMPRMSLIWEGK